MASLLAVDVGVRTGLALWGDDGRLRWYRSQNFGSAARLRRAVPAILEGERDLARLVLEGGGPIERIWRGEAEGRRLAVQQVSAEDWRALFLYPRDQRSGVDAKRAAGDLARRIIAWAGARRPTSLTHDAAEAIAVGLWGAVSAGWIRALPSHILRG